MQLHINHVLRLGAMSWWRVKAMLNPPEIKKGSRYVAVKAHNLQLHVEQSLGMLQCLVSSCCMHHKKFWTILQAKPNKMMTYSCSRVEMWKKEKLSPHHYWTWWLESSWQYSMQPNCSRLLRCLIKDVASSDLCNKICAILYSLVKYVLWQLQWSC